MPLKKSHRKLLEQIPIGIAIGIVASLIAAPIIANLSGLCSIFCPQKTTIEGVITQNDKPVNNVNIIINGHNAVTGTDGKYVISDINVEQEMTSDVSFPPNPKIGYDSHYYLDIEPVSMLQRLLNNGKFPEIKIHFKLKEDEANNNLRLFLNTLEGTHKWEGKNIPYFKMKVKIESSKGAYDLGEYTFGDSPYVCEEDITIDNRLIDSGENIILLENANPEGEGYWVFFDSLKLDMSEGHTIWELGSKDQSSEEFFNPWKANCMLEWVN